MPTRVYHPIDISIGSAVLAELTNMTNRQTDTQTTLLRLLLLLLLMTAVYVVGSTHTR